MFQYDTNFYKTFLNKIWIYYKINVLFKDSSSLYNTCGFLILKHLDSEAATKSSHFPNNLLLHHDHDCH